MLRSSGCLKLPSKRTLRDYTHYINSTIGFSNQVDQELARVAAITTCTEGQKCVVLLLDEMHIKEDLVYDKHSGALIGFTNLGDINDHLAKVHIIVLNTVQRLQQYVYTLGHIPQFSYPHVQFESSMQRKDEAVEPLAKSMLVLMVRGLIMRLQFPYAQFPCCDLTEEEMFIPFWEAVRRLETIGLKVLAATFDGASPNRRLVKIHALGSQKSGVPYKVLNPYALEERYLFFISDPPPTC